MEDTTMSKVTRTERVKLLPLTELSARLERYRLEHGLTGIGMARLLDESPATVRRLEKNDPDFRPSKVLHFRIEGKLLALIAGDPQPQLPQTQEPEDPTNDHETEPAGATG